MTNKDVLKHEAWISYRFICKNKQKKQKHARIPYLFEKKYLCGCINRKYFQNSFIL